MCGFACLWKVGDEGLASRMIDKIAHRGPDAVEVVRGDGKPVVMAHCRLSIIGPEDGAQPIYQDGEILVANGEIYNHADLRAILGESAFETESDSEAILHLFRSGELRWISRLDGMFAFVLATKERIIAARDPLGIKPLYVARVGGGLAFASELKAIMTGPGISPALNHRRLGQVLTLHLEDTVSTAYQGICRLPPAHTLLVVCQPDIDR
jgi:asparagine synthase (glutamine-hydrolysing)